MKHFRNREDAGRQLAAALEEYKGRQDVLVLALPRGGVPVAHEIARALQAPLDIWLVRKLGVPQNEEVAMGAIALGDHQYLDQRMIAYLNVPEDAIEQTIARETQELRRRNQLYRLGKALPQLNGLRVILVDDGLATGASMKVTVQSVQNAGAAEIIVAVPVGPANVCRELEQYVDRVLCLNQPHPFDSVSRWYGDFRQTTDDEVRHLLASQAWLENTGTDESP